MKRIIFITIQILFINCYSQKNESNTLKSKTELENYVRVNSKRFAKFELKKIHDFAPESDAQDSICRRIGDSLKINEYYYKADFDNNGLLDFLLIGDDHNCDESRSIRCNFCSLVLMSFPKDSVKMYNINLGDGCFVTKIAQKNNQTVLQIYNRRRGVLSAKGNNVEQHTLIYKCDGFIDYNKRPVKHSIEKIEFSTFGCYGTCPVFSLVIDKERNSTFFAERFNFGTEEENMKKMSSFFNNNREGTFKTVITEENYNQILALLEYMNFANFQNENMLYEEDSGSSILKITYDNGKEKIIEDYGIVGSYSLRKLYELLFELRMNQKWN
ncbi:DUF6438 domain-containing protein [Flavobacterium sp. SLB02]|uniref:DUF6438 domain-containing protein n=1 Tax=Flavobacterium sp. SLB02 TaxID=2665645 RepID=UPI0012A81BC4|nr:DUF6438 domain-containing protein [Flavobacterium sp. SLB02]QGK72702.1 hypothetical protein GIY83_01035 [Flavobacterium sp. SLB02]